MPQRCPLSSSFPKNLLKLQHQTGGQLHGERDSRLGSNSRSVWRYVLTKWVVLVLYVATEIAKNHPKMKTRQRSKFFLFDQSCFHAMSVIFSVHRLPFNFYFSDNFDLGTQLYRNAHNVSMSLVSLLWSRSDQSSKRNWKRQSFWKELCAGFSIFRGPHKNETTYIWTFWVIKKWSLSSQFGRIFIITSVLAHIIARISTMQKKNRCLADPNYFEGELPSLPGNIEPLRRQVQRFPYGCLQWRYRLWRRFDFCEEVQPSGKVFGRLSPTYMFRGLSL
jgi:hypothetical protein